MTTFNGMILAKDTDPNEMRGWPAYSAQDNDLIGGYIVTTFPWPLSHHDFRNTRQGGEPMKKGYVVAECITRKDAETIAGALNRALYVPDIAYSVPAEWRWVSAGYLGRSLIRNPYHGNEEQ